MERKTEKIPLTMSQWADVLDFIHSNYQHIQTMVNSTLYRDMIEAKIVLTNFVTGSPKLSLEKEYPDNQDRITVAIIPAPVLVTSNLPFFINYSLENCILFVSNQVTIIPDQ